MRRAVDFAGNTCLALVILAVAFLFVTPHLLGMNLFTIYGGSMMPTIPIGSVVATRPVEASAIKAGDIITFRTDTEANKVVTHRVTEVLDGGGALSFRTAGDANANPDGSPVLAENIAGKVWFHVPLLGYFSSFAFTKLGFLLLIVVPGAFIISLEVRSIIVELRSMRKVACTGSR